MEGNTALFPAWSPDGSKIAFALRAPQADLSDIWIMDAEGNGNDNLTDGDARGATAPAWSPGGDQLAFAGEDGIWVMDVVGGHLILVRKGAGLEAPAWRPAE